MSAINEIFVMTIFHTKGTMADQIHIIDNNLSLVNSNKLDKISFENLILVAK